MIKKFLNSVMRRRLPGEEQTDTTNHEHRTLVSTVDLIPIGMFNDSNRGSAGKVSFFVSFLGILMLSIGVLPLIAVLETLAQFLRSWLGDYGQNFLRIPDENPLDIGVLLTAMPLMAAAYLYLLRDGSGQLIDRKWRSSFSDWILNIGFLIMLLGVAIQLSIAAYSATSGSPVAEELLDHLHRKDSQEPVGTDEPNNLSLILSIPFIVRIFPAVLTGDTLVYIACVGILAGLFGTFQSMRKKVDWEKDAGLKQVAKLEGRLIEEINKDLRRHDNSLILRILLNLRGDRLYGSIAYDEHAWVFSPWIAWRNLGKNVGRSLLPYFIANIVSWIVLVILVILSDSNAGFTVVFGVISTSIGMLAAGWGSLWKFKMKGFWYWMLGLGIVLNQLLLALGALVAEGQWWWKSSMALLVFTSYLLLLVALHWRSRNQKSYVVDGKNPRISLRQTALNPPGFAETTSWKEPIKVPKSVPILSTLALQETEVHGSALFYFLRLSTGFPRPVDEPRFVTLDVSIASFIFFSEIRSLGRMKSEYTSSQL